MCALSETVAYLFIRSAGVQNKEKTKIIMWHSLPALVGFAVVVCLAAGAISPAAGCPRTPTHLPHGRRTRGDNGYKLIVADGPNGYVPGKAYNCKS